MEQREEEIFLFSSKSNCDFKKKIQHFEKVVSLFQDLQNLQEFEFKILF